MSEAGFALSLGVAVFFGWAGALKLANMSVFVGQLDDYEFVPRVLLRPIGLLVPTAEIGGAVLAILPATRPIGIVVLIALLIAFSGATARSLRRGRTDIRCACFGSRSQPLGWSVPLRNLILASFLLLGLSAANPGLTAAGVAGAALAAALMIVTLESAKLFEQLRAAQ